MSKTIKTVKTVKTITMDAQLYSLYCERADGRIDVLKTNMTERQAVSEWESVTANDPVNFYWYSPTVEDAQSVTTTTTKVKTVKTSANPGGVIVYEGPSRIDGAPIVAVVTFKTNNAKTGNMAQLWIIRSDVNPILASQTGADEAVCGGCPLRGLANGKNAVGRSCYVNLSQAPLAIYNAYLRGSYPVASNATLRKGIAGRAIRLGAYGDPVALPLDVLARVVSFSSGHTGYSHQWRLPIATGYERFLMASVESEQGADEAVSAGWRYFRVRRDSDPVLKGEIICPASDEGRNRTVCALCKACDGYKRDGQSSVVIIGHGGIASSANVARMLDRFASAN